MARCSDSADVSIKLESEACDAAWSEEHERVPLKQRLKLLLASKRLPQPGLDISAISEPATTNVVRNHSNQCYSQEEKVDILDVKQNGAGEVKECVSSRAEGDKSMGRSQMTTDNIMLDKVDAVNSTLLQFLPSDLPIKTKVSAVNKLKKCVNYSSSVDVETTVKLKNETPEFLDELDFVVLKERQRMLLSRKALSLERKTIEEVYIGNMNGRIIERNEKKFEATIVGLPLLEVYIGNMIGRIIERNEKKFEATIVGLVARIGRDLNLIFHNSSILWGTSPALSSLAEDNGIKRGNGVGKEDDTSSDRDLPMAGDHSKISDLSNFTVHGLSDSCQKDYSSNLVSSKRIQGNDCKARLSSAIVNVKVEPLESIELETTGKYATENPPYNCFLPVKREQEVPNDSYLDKLDHMLLQERMKLFSNKAINSSGGDGISASLSEIVPSVFDSTPIASAAAEPLKINRPRKRRKTATDSIEEALEEDAPGLLKVLLEKGVSVDEIKLYGEPESNEALDDLPTEDSFSELEEIISKLFSRRDSLFKLGPLHISKGEKPSYCLACLFSLVEQARSLQFRKWPVEWGWCRDLQSFIFVFERHNRIVLERPEYGYATYFFELVESVSIHWQIKRLVTAMKLTNCSRISLIENRALLVGEDLSEGEARVLMGYGWIPNTGLGSMLNYCDRVFHDRKHERDSSEWRSKIGKMLIEGYNGGKVVLTDIRMNLPKYNVDEEEDIKVKLEMD
nr:High-affinity branched-chain amino acid transport system permease protein like [Ipomoea batatas]